MSIFDQIKEQLSVKPKKWLITGVAGFIGSNLLETLLRLNQEVVGIDNLAGGFIQNLVDIKNCLELDQCKRFTFLEYDIRNMKMCQEVCEEVDYIVHLAALGSVQRSFENPCLVNENNVSGFLNILASAKQAGVERLVYASSSSVYGNHPDLPKVEDKIGRPLSPYAISKYVDELYADILTTDGNLSTIGLRFLMFLVQGKILMGHMLR